MRTDITLCAAKDCPLDCLRHSKHYPEGVYSFADFGPHRTIRGCQFRLSNDRAGYKPRIKNED